MKIRRKYLKDIESDYRSIRDLKVERKRKKKFKKQQKRYGFDERETWNLDYLILELLYERLRMYKDLATEIIDLDYSRIDSDGGEYTQQEVLDTLISLAEKALADKGTQEERRAEKDFWALWAKTYDLFWW